MTDLISRQAALDEIDKNRQALLSLGMDGAEHILVHYGRRVLEELPTIEPKNGKMTREQAIYILRHATFLGSDEEREREKQAVEIVAKKGKWLNGNYRQICSVCRYKGYLSWKFCPHCGAKMERSESCGT